MSVGYAIVRDAQVTQLFWVSSRNEDALRTLPPLAELSIVSLTKTYPSFPFCGNMLKGLEEVYRNCGRFGPFGDLIQFELDFRKIPGGEVRITFIAPLAFPKPALAADLVLFIRDAAQNVFWLGIERGQPPGVGKQALVGGFREVRPALEHPVMNLIHEAPEELGVRFLPLDQFTTDPYPEEFHVLARIPDLLEDTSLLLKLIGSEQTDPASDYDPKTDTYRVHETCGYVGVIHAKTVLSAELITLALHPTDVVEKTKPIVREVFRGSTSAADQIGAGFHSRHHRDLFMRGWQRIADEVISQS